MAMTIGCNTSVKTLIKYWQRQRPVKKREHDTHLALLLCFIYYRLEKTTSFVIRNQLNRQKRN
jgi:hypothetical protein